MHIELEKLNIHSVILHQDSYYKLPPNENHQRRKTDLNWVGVNEVKLDLLETHIAQFRNGDDFIMAPVVDYEKNLFLTHEALIKNKTVLIVEGVYAFELAHLDYKIFMNRTYKETMHKRKARNREIYDPFVERVLEIEHALIQPLKEKADLLVEKDYSIAPSSVSKNKTFN